MTATKLKENATRKMAPGLGQKKSATGTEKIFRALETSGRQSVLVSPPEYSTMGAIHQKFARNKVGDTEKRAKH